ncbi:MAG: tRNA glutamyl-Q(34) synthetase GluQRS [Pseudomonadota bacterium]
MTTSAFITRFAPSPTGYLHLGHAFAAQCTFAAAAERGGLCHLRIEDTDRTRCKPAFETAIVADLRWLGFDWPTPIRRQADHLADYEGALAELREKGLVYRCFKTRKQVMEDIDRAPHLALPKRAMGQALTTADPGWPVFTGHPLPNDQEAALIAAEKPYAWRLSMARCRDYLGAEWASLFFQEEGTGEAGERRNGESRTVQVIPDLFGDEIIARKDTHTSYHLACVHDDALQNVTHVVRGKDLFSVTHLHVLLQRLLGLKTPIYRHHDLLTDETGQRLAKRNQAITLRHLRSEGHSPADIVDRVNAMLGTSAL